jgi:hypothetical protein
MLGEQKWLAKSRDLRSYASHIAEILGLDSDDTAKWHPFENYIRPALQEARSHTGDIFQLDGMLWVVLTPQCDMATKKTKSVLLACCESNPKVETWKEAIAGLKSDSAKQKRSAEEFLGKLINQAQPGSHFLPPLVNGQPMTVNFKHLRTIDLSELEGKLSDRIASISPPFLTNLTQRFGAYVSRVGQPNIDMANLS